MKKIGLLLILLLVITSCESAGTNSEEIWECIVVETTPAQVNENYYRFTTDGGDEIVSADNSFTYFYSFPVDETDLQAYRDSQTEFFTDIDGVDYSQIVEAYGSQERIIIDYEVANMQALIDKGLVIFDEGLPTHVSLQDTISSFELDGECAQLVDESQSLINELVSTVGMTSGFSQMNTTLFDEESVGASRLVCYNDVADDVSLNKTHTFELNHSQDLVYNQKIEETFPIYGDITIQEVEITMADHSLFYNGINGVEFEYSIDEENMTYVAVMTLDFEVTDFAELVNSGIIGTTADGEVPTYISSILTVQGFPEPWVCEEIGL